MTDTTSTVDSKPSLNPSALPIPEAAKLLTTVGGQPVTEAMLQSDITAGAPTNPDGTLNLVLYGAWLVKEMTRAP